MAGPSFARAPVLTALLAGAVLVPVAACDATPVAPCATDQLQITMVPLGGATSSRYDAVVFTNTATATCTLQGFPGFAPVDDSGAAVGEPADPDPVAGDPQVVVGLGPGATAHALVTSVAPGAFPADLCGEVVQAAAADVTVPDGGTVPVPFALDRCTTGVARLTIGAFTAGTPVPGG